jgi:hypothetical protein
VVSRSAGRTPHDSEALRFGCTEPRIFTPPLRDLDEPGATLGHDVIAFAQDDLGITLHPYQKWLYIHVLELLPNGDFRFDKIVILIARQNGKTMWWKILILYVMYILGMKLVLSTAQDLDTAEETWEAVVAMVLETDEDEVPIRPDLAECVAKVVLTNGKKSLNLTTGERYKAKAASRRAARGLSGDLIGLDEAREQQNWDSWSAITHTTMARARSLIILLSNAGDVTSVVLRYFRMAAHALLGNPDGIVDAEEMARLVGIADEDLEDEDLDADDLGLFEYSAAPGAAIRDRAGWAQANPSMNYPNGVPERKIRAATKEPEWVFRTEVLCQWPEGALEGPFPPTTWDAGWDESSRIAGDPVLCVETNLDRSMTYIAAAGVRDDGRLHAEMIAKRAGTDWVVDWFTDAEKLDRMKYRIRMRPKSPGSTLINDLRLEGIVVEEWLGDMAPETGTLFDLVKDGRLMHLPDSSLDRAAATAIPRVTTSGFVWDQRRSPTDCTPLIAVTGAVAALMPKHEETKDPQVHEWPAELFEEDA